MRLVGSSDSEGTVEVCINNLWGLIGDAGWNNADAVVVCRQLGLPTGGITWSMSVRVKLKIMTCVSFVSSP